MYKVKFSTISDIVFTFFSVFIISFIILNYFCGRINAIIISIWASLFITTIVCFFIIKQNKKGFLTKKQEKECSEVLTALSFASQVKVCNLFFDAFYKKHLSPEKTKGGIFISAENSLYFIKFSFDGITKTDIVKFFNRLTGNQKAVVCSQSFGKEITDFAKRFNGKILLKDGKWCYELLKEQALIPLITKAPYSCSGQKANFTPLMQRKNAKKFFIFGVTFCAMSFFVPIKLYYTIFGCLMLITSVVLTFFGKKTTE